MYSYNNNYRKYDNVIPDAMKVFVYNLQLLGKGTTSLFLILQYFRPKSFP